MAKLNSKWEDHHEYVWPCECNDSHYITIVWDEPDAEWRYLNIENVYWPYRIRDRIKAAFTVLRGKPHYHSGVVLDEKNVEEVLKALQKHTYKT